MCMLWLISEDGKSIKLIKQALAYENKSVTLKHFQKQVFLSLGVWVGGDSGGGGGDNFGMGVRASILKPTQNIYLAFEKTALSYTNWFQRKMTYSYTCTALWINIPFYRAA